MANNRHPQWLGQIKSQSTNHWPTSGFEFIKWNTFTNYTNMEKNENYTTEKKTERKNPQKKKITLEPENSGEKHGSLH